MDSTSYEIYIIYQKIINHFAIILLHINCVVHVSAGLPCVCMCVSRSALCVPCVSAGLPCVCMCVGRSALCVHVCQPVCLVCACVLVSLRYEYNDGCI